MSDPQEKLFVIAEIGINHNGSVDLARRLIDVAKVAGCDAVKFQKRTIDVVYTQEYLDSPRESPWGSTNREQKEHLEFGEEQFKAIDAHCRSREIEWFASAWDLQSLAFLDRFKLGHNKVASAMVVDMAFLEAVASRKKHTFISTGLSTLDDIDRAVDVFRAHECPFELMHCVGTYPMEAQDANLKVIKTLRERYNCSVGYSGHEPGLAVSYAAAAFGISSLERHVTLDRAMYGSDQAASVEPIGLMMLVGAVRKICMAVGDGTKRVLPAEEAVAKKLRQHLPLA